VSLLDTGVGGTIGKVVPRGIDLKLPPTTNQERHFRKERDSGFPRSENLVVYFDSI
jgi:hypothetical protein